MKHPRSITPLLQRRVAFLRKFRRADTHEHKIAVAGVLNALRYMLGNGNGVARANGERCRIANGHQAVALLDNVHLVDR